MWADGTWLSVNGNHTAKPCLLGIGNHPLEVQHKVESKKVSVWLCAALTLRCAASVLRYAAPTLRFQVKHLPILLRPAACSLQQMCLWFDLGGAKDHKSRVAYRRYKITLNHDLIYEMLGPVREAQANGGFRFKMANGDPVLAYPVMCLVVVDTPERHSMAQVYGSVQAEEPCSFCLQPGRMFPNIQAALDARLRTTIGTNTTRLACLAGPNATERLREVSRECAYCIASECYMIHLKYPCLFLRCVMSRCAA